MSLNTLQDWATVSLSPTIPAIVITFLIAPVFAILLHWYFYRTKPATRLPTFLLVGPSGSGKTSLLTLLERGTPSETHISQVPLTVQVTLPSSNATASSQYRSSNDPSNTSSQKFLLADTPGHGKLRHHALGSLVKPQNLRGIIYVVDATTLTPDAGLTEAAEYLHDVLLVLQKRHTSSNSSKGPAEIPVLIAPNKLDLFTALPVKLVKSALESEITKLRSTRSRGLLDSGIGIDDMDDERETLGGGGERKFEFALMEEYNVPVQIAGGNVLGADGADASKWWEWISKQL